MELLLPYWKRYLQNKGNLTIISFITKMASVPKVKEELAVCANQRYSHND